MDDHDAGATTGLGTETVNPRSKCAERLSLSHTFFRPAEALYKWYPKTVVLLATPMIPLLEVHTRDAYGLSGKAVGKRPRVHDVRLSYTVVGEVSTSDFWRCWVHRNQARSIIPTATASGGEVIRVFAWLRVTMQKLVILIILFVAVSFLLVPHVPHVWQVHHIKHRTTFQEMQLRPTTTHLPNKPFRTCVTILNPFSWPWPSRHPCTRPLLQPPIRPSLSEQRTTLTT